MNVFIQYFFAIPTLRQFALQSQTVPFYFGSPLSLWCEFGFLFHMFLVRSNEMGALSSSSPADRVDQYIIPSNFQRTLMQIPEVVALDLLDAPGSGSSGTSGSDAQAKITKCIRFFTQQLQREIELENKALLTANGNGSSGTGSTSLLIERRSPLTELFESTLRTSIEYQTSELTENSVGTSLLPLDLVYSHEVRGHVLFGKPTDPSFVSLLWHTLQRVTSVR